MYPAQLEPQRVPWQWYCCGVRATIDRAGRVVIPKRLREQVGIGPGEITIEVDGSGLRIEPLIADTTVEDDGRLVIPAGERTFTEEEIRELRFVDQR